MTLTRKQLNFLILDYFCIFAFISAFIGGSAIWNLSTIPVFVLAIIVNRDNRIKIESNILVLVLLVFFLFTLSTMASGNTVALFSNIRSSLYSICVLFTSYLLSRNDTKMISEYLYKRVPFFNLFLIVNIIIVFFQAKGTGFLIKNEWLVLNGYYDDHCAGLFGMNSTNHLGVFSIFVMLLNFGYCETQLTSRKRKLMFLYTIFSQIAMAVASQFNDNVGFYILLLIFGGLYGVITIIRYKSIIKKLKKSFKYVGIVAIAVLLLFTMPGISDYAQRVLIYRYTVLFKYNSMGGAAGSSERFAIIEYAFNNASTWLFGVGTGSQEWFGDAFGFHSFGLNSAGSYILLGGIWYYIVYTLLYSTLFSRMIKNRKYRCFKFMLVVILVTVLLSLYTALYNDARMVFLISLICFCYKLLMNDYFDRRIKYAK